MQAKILIERLVMILNYSRIDGDKYTVSISFSEAFDGILTTEFKCTSCGRTVTRETPLSSGKDFVVVHENVEFLSGDYIVTVTAGSESKCVKYVNGYPQLSGDTVKMAVAEMTLYEKCSLFVAMGADRHMAATTYVVERLGIPMMYLADGPAGLRVNVPTVGYPSGTTLANTWDPSAMEKVTAFMGDDCNSFGVDILLAPGMNIQRYVLNGRNFEYFSEDPYLNGIMAGHYTLGVQSAGVGVSLKHYTTNNQEFNRGGVSTVISERALREIYLKGYEYAVEMGNPYTVMTAYNKINGVCAPTAKDLITDVLRNEFGFDGFVMSDWGAQGTKDAMIAAGNDMYCGSPDVPADIAAVKEMVENGKIDEKALDLCCEKILSVVARSQAMNRGEVSYTISNKAEKLQTVRKVGADGMILMKNDGMLPMQNGKNIALFGNASYITEHCGYGAGYVIVSHVVTVKEGFENANFSINGEVASLYTDCKRHPHILTQEMNPTDDQFEIVITEEIAEKAAQTSDFAVFTISRMTAEGVDHADIKGDFYLNDREMTAITNISNAFRKAGKKFVVLINVGNPIEVASWADKADAILCIGLSGEQIGNSMADVFTGAVNPSGKLAVTWPVSYNDTAYSELYPDKDHAVYSDDIYVGYRYFTTFNAPAMYEFGYGLSYTDYEYSDFKVEKTENGFTLGVKVTNKGYVTGRETVQFYVTKPETRNEHPVRELVGFGKTPELSKGESATVTVNVTNRELMTYFAPEAKWIVEKGEYVFSAGASVKDIRLTANATVEDEIFVRQVMNVSPIQLDIDSITKKNPKKVDVKGENLALYKTVYASGEEKGCEALYAVDGSHFTRWSALGTEGENYWITVDLGEVSKIEKLVLEWESNALGEFTVSVSDDNESWKDINKYKYEPKNVIDLDVRARYVRVLNKKDGFFSIYNIGIY